MNYNVLDNDHIGRLLVKLAIPAFTGMFVATLYNVVDTIFIGQYVGSLGIAGLSIVFPLQMLSMGLGQMTGMGGASLVSRLIGAGNKNRAEKALGNAIIVNIILSLVILVAGLAYTDGWLRIMGASETVLPYARDYMSIILVGLVFQTLDMAMNALLRAEGNARVPMVAMVIGAVSNIILDAVFIIPLQMGIKGAAIATVIAQVFSVIYTMFYYFSGNSFLKIKLRNLKLDFGTIKEIFTIGVASFGRTIGGSLSMVFVNRMLASYGGDYAVSTFGVVNRIMMFAIMPGIVIGQGLQPILGFNYGAQRYDRALKVIKLALIAATISSVIVFAVLYIVPGPVIRIFTGDNELIGQASYAARRIFIGISLIGAMMVGSTVFQAIGKATQSFVTSIARGVLFLFPLVFTLPRFWGTDGVWISFPIADALSLILTLSLFIPQVKKMSELNKHSREISEPQVQT